MAEENTATSSHLDSYMHVYDNGTTARLYVTPWDRNTVADGYWQTVNTIQPLINRDVYLADCIDKLAEKNVVYSAGYGIIIEPNNSDGYYKISVNAKEVINDIPKYNFNTAYFTTSKDLYTDTVTVGLKLKNDGCITADNVGIYCNVEKLMHSTSSLSSYSSVSANTISSFSYDYKVASSTVSAVTGLPSSPDNGVMVYLVG